MALISTTTTDADGLPSGEFVGDSFTGVNLRASHTIMVRVKHGSTATNYHSIIAAYIAQADITGSYIGRDSGGTSTGLDWTRQAAWPYGRDEATVSTCYGDTSTWYHVALVYNATTGQKRAYIDGTYISEQASSTTRTSSTTAVQFVVGAANGKFADAAVFDRALSDQEVADMAAYRVPQVTSGLRLFWRLDSDGTDSSGNGLDGVESGGTPAVSWSTSDNPPQPETPTVDIAGGATTGSTLAGALTVAKAFGGAATSASTLAGDLRLTKQIAAAATSASTLSGDLTLTKQLTAAASTASSLAAWIRPRWGRRIAASAATDLTRGGASVSASAFTLMTWFRTLDSSSEFRVGWISNAVYVGSNAGSLRIRLFDNNTTSFSIDYSGADDLQWHHLALTFDGATARAYVDGSQVASAGSTVSGTFGTISWDALSSGSGIAEVAHTKIWGGVALTAAEIVQEKEFYTPSHHNTLLHGWWQLGWQDVTLDSSGNGRTLTDNGSLEAQTEAPGLPLTDLAAAATSASTLAGTLSVAKPLAGASTSASTLAGTLSQAQPLVGAGATASALSGTLSVAKPIAGAASSSSALAGTLSQNQPLTAAASTASSLSGFLDVSVPLAAAASTSSELTGTLGVHLPIAGGATTRSTLTGALGIEGAFSGNALTASTLAGTLSVDKPIAGAASTASSLTGILSQLQPLDGAASTASSLAGAITVIKQAEGAASTSTSLAGSLSVANALAGAASTASTLSGTLSLTQQLVAAAQSASTLTGTLTVQNVLSGAASSSSHLAGTLNVDVIWYLSAVARTGSYLTGALTVTVPASARGNVVTDGSAAAYYGPATIVGPGRPRRWPPRY